MDRIFVETAAMVGRLIVEDKYYVCDMRTVPAYPYLALETTLLA